MKKIILSLLAIGLFPVMAFPQFLCQDTISLKLNSEVVITYPEIGSKYEYLYDILPVIEGSLLPCAFFPGQTSYIIPIDPHSSYPSPYSANFGTNKQHIHISKKGRFILVMRYLECNIGYLVDLGLLNKGSEIWHSPGELKSHGYGPGALNVVMNEMLYDGIGIAYFPELSEGLEIGWEPNDIYPNCTLVKTADTSGINKNYFDFMFEIKDEYPFTILELLNSNDELIRYFFRMYLNKGIYGVYFSRIDATYKPLEYGDYKLRLTIADSSYICNFKIVE